MKTQSQEKSPLHHQGLSEMKKKLCRIANVIRLSKKDIVIAQKKVDRTKNHEDADSYAKILNAIFSKRIKLANMFRHYHVAYCELRGTSRKKIENTVRAKKINEAIIEIFKL